MRNPGLDDRRDPQAAPRYWVVQPRRVKLSYESSNSNCISSWQRFATGRVKPARPPGKAQPASLGASLLDRLSTSFLSRLSTSFLGRSELIKGPPVTVLSSTRRPRGCSQCTPLPPLQWSSRQRGDPADAVLPSDAVLLSVQWSSRQLGMPALLSLRLATSGRRRRARRGHRLKEHPGSRPLTAHDNFAAQETRAA